MAKKLDDKKLFSGSDWVPYSSHITPKIIKIKGGSYVMSFKLSGVSYIGVAQEIIDARVRQMSRFIALTRSPFRYNVYIHQHCVKRNIRAGLPENFPPHSFVSELDDDYNRAIHSYPILGTEYYLSLIYRPYRRRGGWTSIGNITIEKIKEFEAQAIETLTKLENLVLEYFYDYGVKTLDCYENKNGVLFSEQVDLFSTLLNLDATPVPVLRAPISEYLAKSHFLYQDYNDFIRIDLPNGQTQYATILSFSEYPSNTYAGMIQHFIELPWQMIVSQTFAPIDKVEAGGWLEREYKRLAASDKPSATELKELEDAQEGVVSDHFLLGDYYFQVALIGDSIKELQQKIGEAQAALSDCGFTAVPFHMAKFSAWVSMLPGNLTFQPRAAKVSSNNVCQILPFQSHNLGKQFGNPWGQAICMFRTMSDEICYFNFHQTERNEDATGQLVAGNTIISGMTGAGKTVLLSFILAQAQRLNPRPKTIIFDKDLGSSVFVNAMKGKYSRIQLGVRTGFNPFHLPDTPQNRAFLLELITAILNEDGGGKVTPDDKNVISKAIHQTMIGRHETADIGGFSHFLPVGKNSLRERLLPWTQGDYEWVFNNPEDNFEMVGSDIIGIDYTEFLDIKAIRTPILMYLFHRIELMLDGKPVIISLDEAWKPLSDPAFAQFIENKERTIRKQNGLLILTTQSPSDFFRGVSDALIGQVGTQIFLPNPRAKREDYIGRLGLEEEEFQIIKNMHKNSRQFLVKQQGETTHCYLNLKGIPAVDVLSGSLARALHAEKLQQEYGEDWLEQYYATVHSIAKKLGETPDEEDEETFEENDDERAA